MEIFTTNFQYNRADQKCFNSIGLFRQTPMVDHKLKISELKVGLRVQRTKVVLRRTISRF